MARDVYLPLRVANFFTRRGRESQNFVCVHLSFVCILFLIAIAAAHDDGI